MIVSVNKSTNYGIASFDLTGILFELLDKLARRT